MNTSTLSTFVNGIKYKTYLLDTTTSIIRRLALERGVLPGRLYTKVDYDHGKRTIEAYSMDELTQKYESHQLQEFYEKYSTEFPEYSLENIAHIWYDVRLQRGKRDNNPFVEITITDYLKSKNIDYSMLKSTLDYFITTQKEKFDSFKRLTELDTLALKLCTSLQPVKSTPLEILRTKTELSFDVDYDIYELFNSLKMSRDMPFAVIGNYYKILKQFTPLDSWTLARERSAADFGDKTEVLYIKLLNVLNEPPQNIHSTKNSLYSTISVYFKPPKTEGDKNISNVVVRFETSLDNTFNEDQLIARLFQNFPKSVNTYSKKQIGVKGEFLLPLQKIDRPVFLHCLLNDPLLSRNFFTDDRNVIKGERGGIYIHYIPDVIPSTQITQIKSEQITFSITEQVVERTSLKVIAKDPDLKPDTGYLRVRVIRCTDEQTARDFQYLFQQVFYRYIQTRDAIVNLYMGYINDFNSVLQKMRGDIESRRKKSTRKKEMLKDIDPDQFISGYSRWLCPAKRAPKIIAIKENPNDPDPPEVEKMEEKNIQTMLFPKLNEENGMKYNQYYYSCDHHAVDKYPALRINKLSNNEKYPIVPCCYKKDHRIKQKSIWRQYYEEGKNFSDFKTGASVEDEIEDDTHIYTTNKILPSKRLGTLTNSINSYFSTIDTTSHYYRIGVNRSSNSVIESLMLALDPDFDGYNTSQRLDEIAAIRKKMLHMVKSSGVYQNAYTFSADTIASYINDTKKYFDPTMFITLLQDYFKCNIFIFTQNDQHPFGMLDCPKFLKRFLSFKNDSRLPYIFIYQHNGVDIDRAEYPQCELVIRMENNEKEYSFKHKDIVVQRTISTFNDMYVADEADNSMIVAFETPLHSQFIDYYGKSRILYFKNGINIYTNPLAPLNLPQTSIDKFRPVSLTLAREFLKIEKCKETKRIVSGTLVGLYSQKGSVEFYIPITPRDDDDINVIDTSQNHQQSPLFIYKNSEINLYNNYHRLARYMTEYMFYYFSKFYHNNKDDDASVTNKDYINRDYINKFVKECIVIDPSFKYGHVDRLFNRENGLSRNGRLILHNKTILKKLIYVLHIKLKTSRDDLLNYKNYTYIQKYYSDIRDFTHLETQPIIYGQDALQKWIENKQQTYTLNDSIIHQDTSLLTEFLKHDVSKPFVVLFGANWHRPSKTLAGKMFKKGGDKESIFDKYSSKINFVYIDTDKNKDLSLQYEVSSIPYIYFFKVENDNLRELSKIRGGDNIYENIKRIDTEIKKII